MKILDALMSQAGGFGDPFASPFLRLEERGGLPGQQQVCVCVMYVCIYVCVSMWTSSSSA